jgi:hypothetical protein
MEPIPGDSFDIEEDDLIENNSPILSEEEKRAILKELGQF